MSLRQALTQLVTSVLAMVNTRLALISLEAAEARQMLFQYAAVAMAAAVCLLMAVLVGTLSIALYFWPTEYRFVALGLLTLVYAVIGLGLGLWLKGCLTRGPVPFAGTVAVLGEDLQALRRPPPPQPVDEPLEVSAPRTGEST